MKKNQFIVIAILITATSLVWILVTPVLFPVTSADASRVAPHPGFLAPGFILESSQGDTVTLADFQGRPVLVFFWASWCSVCKIAMPGLEAVYRDLSPQGFTILAVNTTNQDTLSSALGYFESQGYTYTLLLDRDGTIAAQYRMRAVPTSVLVGPDGIITDVIYGSGISAGFLRARLGEMLAEGAD